MRPEDLLKLFEEDAKVLDKEVTTIKIVTALRDSGPLFPARPIGPIRRKKTKREPVFIEWQSIEGPLTPRSFPLPETQLTKSFRDELVDMFEHATEPCPDIATILGYVNHELDAATAENVAAHILHCEDCAEEFTGLSNVPGKP